MRRRELAGWFQATFQVSARGSVGWPSSVERTVRTPPPREAFGQDPAAEEVAELVLDKGRQAVAVGAIRGGSPEGLEVLPNDGGEHGVLGVARPIRGVRMRHAFA